MLYCIEKEKKKIISKVFFFFNCCLMNIQIKNCFILLYEGVCMRLFLILWDWPKLEPLTLLALSWLRNAKCFFLAAYVDYSSFLCTSGQNQELWKFLSQSLYSFNFVNSKINWSGKIEQAGVFHWLTLGQNFILRICLCCRSKQALFLLCSSKL